MNIETTFINRCITGLIVSLDHLAELEQQEGELYDICCESVVDQLETLLEQCGKLLRKCLLPYFHSRKATDALIYKDLFRHAGRHGILSIEEVERWLEYRDNRDNLCHNSGRDFTEKTLPLLPRLITDAQALVTAIEKNSVAEKTG